MAAAAVLIVGCEANRVSRRALISFRRAKERFIRSVRKNPFEAAYAAFGA
jgi:hypothetical protein